MRTLTAKATTTTTDQGQFDALAAVFGNVDRDGDRIVRGAFADSIRAWKQTGRSVPLHWNHEADPESIIGTIDPASMRETSDGLRVSGRLDLDGSAKAREVWRLVKSGSIGLSFGYLVERKRSGSDGANELLRLDVFEISLTSAPANANARVISWKSVEREGDEDDGVPTDAELRQEFEELTGRADASEVARHRDAMYRACSPPSRTATARACAARTAGRSRWRASMRRGGGSELKSTRSEDRRVPQLGRKQCPR